MKFSLRQILASASGAVLAAVIASLFGVKGTIVGVALGSAAATFGTALVAQSIERGHKAVKQVVVQLPESSHLLRRLGGTDAAGESEGVAEENQILEQRPESTTSPAWPKETVEVPIPAAPTEATAGAVSGGTERNLRWPMIAGTAAIVFVLSLMFVTAVELIAGRPLADLFGAHTKGGGTTVQQIIESPPTTLPTPVPTTSTTSTTSSTSTSSSSTTSTTSSATTTSTTAGASTTTTVPGLFGVSSTFAQG